MQGFFIAQTFLVCFCQVDVVCVSDLYTFSTKSSWRSLHSHGLVAQHLNINQAVNVGSSSNLSLSLSLSPSPTDSGLFARSYHNKWFNLFFVVYEGNGDSIETPGKLCITYLAQYTFKQLFFQNAATNMQLAVSIQMQKPLLWWLREGEETGCSNRQCIVARFK